MKIPANIKVGSITYDIHLVDKIVPTDADGKELQLEVPEGYIAEIHGQQNTKNSTISIVRGCGKQYERVVALHEVVHAVLENAGFEFHDEGVVNALAYGLYNVIQENPSFITYLKEK